MDKKAQLRQKRVTRLWAQITARSLTGKLDRDYVMKCAKYVSLYSRMSPDGSNPESEEICEHLLNKKPLSTVLASKIHRIIIHDDPEVEAKEFEEKFNPYI